MNLLLLMQAVPQEAAEETTEVTIDYIEMAFSGGWIMIPLLLLSVISVYIFFERHFAIKRSSKVDDTFMNRIKDYIHDGKIDSALGLCLLLDFVSLRIRLLPE